jgi:hypothetical protein
MALTLAASAQVTVGDNISMNLNGQASFGYTGDYGSTIKSDHGLNFGGTGNLTGSYYSPNFLNFDVSPYYNQSRANSTSQAISDSSGVTASAFLFSGSHFPGSVSYSKSYNSLGTFGAPGIANFTSHGNSDGLSVGWGVNLPDLPSLNATYLQGHNNYSIYGEDANGSSTYRNLNLNSNYRVAGFNLNGGYVRSQTHSDYPLLITNERETAANSGDSYSFGASHDLPLHGSASGNFNHSDFDSEFSQGSYHGSINTVSSNVSVHPKDNLALGANFVYTDNLVGTLVQNIVTVGGIIRQETPGQSSNSLDMSGIASYNLTQHFLLSGTIERRQQQYFGKTFGSNGMTGSVGYWNHVLGGSLSSVLAVTRTTVDSSGLSRIGLLSSLTYSRRMGNWELSGSGNYYQNTQTLLVGYTTSGFGFTAAVGRKIGYLHWNGSAGGSRSLLNTAAGYGSHAQNYTTGLSARWFGVSASYAKSDGTALLGGTGLVPTPLPNPIPLPTDIIVYGGHSYGGGLGLNPFKRFTASASFSRAFSDTLNGTLGSHNNTENAVVHLQYQFRQMWFTAGYSKFTQGFSASSTAPAEVNTYFFGVQRWFNFF